MDLTLDLADTVALLLIGLVVAVMGFDGYTVLAAQAGLLIFDWIGRRLIDRWVDRFGRS
jgi:hypothetical protein